MTLKQRIMSIGLSTVLLSQMSTVSIFAQEKPTLTGQKTFETKEEANSFVQELKNYNIELNKNKSDGLRYTLYLTGPTPLTTSKWMEKETLELESEIFKTQQEAQIKKDSYTNSDERTYNLTITKQEGDKGSQNTTTCYSLEDADNNLELVKNYLIEQGIDEETIQSELIKGTEIQTTEPYFKVEDIELDENNEYTIKKESPVVVITLDGKTYIWTIGELAPEIKNSILEKYNLREDNIVFIYDYNDEESNEEQQNIASLLASLPFKIEVIKEENQPDKVKVSLTPAENLDGEEELDIDLQYAYSTVEKEVDTYMYNVTYSIPVYVLSGTYTNFEKVNSTTYTVKWEYKSTKSTEVQTGIVSNYSVYIVLAAIALVGMFVVLRKRK
ncbi:hypothetical protein [Floccifex sp.]|uniref:hypothetical protein n=1 Tax=Floccifex sp. TaxID=2815810 RepID=UPI003F09E7A5